MTDDPQPPRETQFTPAQRNNGEVSETRARQAISGQGVRYVLIASLCAVVIALIIVALTISNHI